MKQCFECVRSLRDLGPAAPPDATADHDPCPSCNDASSGARLCTLCRHFNDAMPASDARRWAEASDLEQRGTDYDSIQASRDGRVEGDPIEPRFAHAGPGDSPFRQDDIDWQTGQRWSYSRRQKGYTALEREAALFFLQERLTGRPYKDRSIATEIGCTPARVGQMREEFFGEEQRRAAIQRELERAVRTTAKRRTKRQRDLVVWLDSLREGA